MIAKFCVTENFRDDVGCDECTRMQEEVKDWDRIKSGNQMLDEAAGGSENFKTI